MGKITWGAVAMHAIAAGFVVASAYGLFGLAAALIAAPLVSAVYAAREAWTAAARHQAPLSQGLRIVLDGEPGWSPWNLRLQALSPVVAAGLVALYALAGG